MSPPGGSRRFSPGLLFVLAAGAFLFAFGLSWGLPSWRGWAGDELLPSAVEAGLRRGFSGGWHTKYPPFHYYLLAAVQAPFRLLQRSGALDLTRFELNTWLLHAGRWLSVLFSLGTLVAVYRTGREVSSRRGAVLASAIVAVMPPFVYFAKTANVEAPYLFWFALSLLFYVRLLRRHRPRDYALFAASAVLAIATKDQAYGLYVLVPIVVLVSLRRHREEAGERPGWIAALLDRRILLALGTGLVLAALAYNLPFNAQGFLRHVRVLTGADTEEARAYANDLPGHFQNLLQNLRNLAFCLGWPLFLACGLGVVRAFRAKGREGFLLRALLIPGLSYYLSFLSVVLFSRDRYVLPLALLLALFGGRLLGDRLLGDHREPGRPLRRLRLAGVAMVLGYGFLRALSVDLAMRNDSRYAAEAWLARRAPPAAALAVGRVKHLPRIPRVDWRRLGPTLDQRRPDYVVVNVVDLRTPRERAAYERLLEGGLGYRPRARFKWRSRWDLLDTRGSLSSLVFVNPEIALFERVPQPMEEEGRR